MSQSRQSRQNLKSGGQDSPKSTVKVAPIGEGRGADTDFAKFRDDMHSMFTQLDLKIGSRIQKIDDKFTSIFEEYRKDLEAIKQDVSLTRKDLTKVVTDVEEIEKCLEFQSEIISKHKREQEDNLTKMQNEMDLKIKELNEKLLLLEKHDRKYNLLFYGIPEERGEYLFEKMRQLFLDVLDISVSRADGMFFMNGHRLPSEPASGPRPVLIKFCSFEDREIVLSNTYKLAGIRRRILTDLPVVMKRERGRLAKQAYKIRQDEKLQTRIKEKGLSVWLEVRKDGTDNWVKRVISID